MNTFLKCRTPLTHSWSKWSDPVLTGSLPARKQQWRACVDCHLVQFRTLGYDHNTPINFVCLAIRSVAGKEL